MAQLNQSKLIKLVEFDRLKWETTINMEKITRKYNNPGVGGLKACVRPIKHVDFPLHVPLKYLDPIQLVNSSQFTNKWMS